MDDIREYYLRIAIMLIILSFIIAGINIIISNLLITQLLWGICAGNTLAWIAILIVLQLTKD